MLRHMLVLAILASTLGACGEGDNGERACCAIVPRAKCEGALLGLNVTREEQQALFGPDATCPSQVMTMARIRELDAEWPQDCRAAGMFSPMQQVGARSCPDASQSPPPRDGINAVEWSACSTGLKARGLTDNELWVMLRHPSQMCPAVGVTEARMREIIDTDWQAAGCTFALKEEMLDKLDSGACVTDPR